MAWKDYKSFNLETGFERSAGFELTSLQISQVEQCAKFGKLLNKSEVGCGKTVVSTAVSYMQGYDVSIVIMPPILVTGWAKWLSKFTTKLVVYRGSPSQRAKIAENLKAARWVVCSHAIFRNEFDILTSAIAKRNYEIIVDEAHWVKNPQSVLFRKVKTLSAGDKGLQLLTGTPTSKPTDSYTYIKLKTPQLYRSYSHFEALHVVERDFFKNPKTYGNLEKLRENFNLHTVSATKEEMHGYNLKPLTPDCTYDLAPEHYKLYRKLVDEQLLAFEDGSLIDATTAQKLRQALQQVIVNWEYFSNDPKNVSQAYAVVDQTIEEIEVSNLSKSKLIIWVTYKRTARNVTDYCNRLGIKTVAAYADSNTERSVQDFLEDEKTRILVANPQSCGAGLNPQYVCSEDLYLEISTSPIYTRQACGRISRMGQTKVPRHKFAIANGTVQVDLLKKLLENDDLVATIEPDKKSIRAMLLGGVDL